MSGDAGEMREVREKKEDRSMMSQIASCCPRILELVTVQLENRGIVFTFKRCLPG